MKITTIGQLTEIQPMGGGSFLTQAQPTNFHTFHRALVLGKNDAAENWREVTAAERTALEAQDAKWEAPTRGLWSFGGPSPI